MLLPLDFEIHIVPINTTAPPQIYKVSQFLLGQRSLYFRTAFTFPLGNPQPFLELCLDVETFGPALDSLIACLNTGKLVGTPLELFNWYALADYLQCKDLKESLVEPYHACLSHPTHGPVLIQKALEFGFLELVPDSCLSKCMGNWIQHENIVEMFTIEALEKILKNCSAVSGESLPKAARWGIYQAVNKITRERYADTEVVSQSSLNSVYLSALPPFFLHDPFKDDPNDDDNGCLNEENEEDTEFIFGSQEQVEMLSKYISRAELWNLIPWRLFSSSELREILKLNSLAPRKTIEPLIATNEDLPAAGDEEVEHPLSEIREEIEFTSWYETTYADMQVKFTNVDGEPSMSDGGDSESFPAHKCILSRIPTIWDSKWDGVGAMTIKEPIYFHKRCKNHLNFILRILYGEMEFIDQVEDQETLFNLLTFAHHFQLEQVKDYIYECMKEKDPDHLWWLFVIMAPQFQYFFELFPSFGQDFISELIQRWEELQPMNCPKLRLAWVNLLASASLMDYQLSNWGSTCANLWFNGTYYFGLDDFDSLMLDMLKSDDYTY